MCAVLKVHVQDLLHSIGARGYNNMVVLDSSAVEHSAVNRRVVGSNPTRGVKKKPANDDVYRFLCINN